MSAHKASVTRLLRFATPTLMISSRSARSSKCFAARSNVAFESSAFLVNSSASAIAAFSASLNSGLPSASVIASHMSWVMPSARPAFVCALVQ